MALREIRKRVEQTFFFLVGRNLYIWLHDSHYRSLD